MRLDLIICAMWFVAGMIYPYNAQEARYMFSCAAVLTMGVVWCRLLKEGGK